MSSSEKKNKRNGIIGTILFHALLLLSFLFMGLTYKIPPPPEEGISINFGFNDEGSEEIQPEDNALESNPIIEEIIQESVEVEQEIITQESIETEVIEIPKEAKKEKEPEKEPEKKQEEIIVEKVEPVVNKKALYTGNKKSDKQSDGNKNQKGNQGLIEGDINSTQYEGGGIGIDGLAYQLLGRNVSYKAKPIYKVQLEGKVVVEITVDRLGNVINAISGVKGSTTLNEQLLKRAKEAALKTKFSAKESAPTRQQGKIIYNFQLN
jgi:TonB family protein|tara:strand:- start:1216 stop:2010 length:795 start_codon:yes stop_codon:yes gene_type:complete